MRIRELARTIFRNRCFKLDNRINNERTILISDKKAFLDRLYLRYGIPLPRLLISATFDVQHASSCSKSYLV